MLLALGVSGAAPLPVFLIEHWLDVADGVDSAHSCQLGAERNGMRPAKPRNSHFSNHGGSKVTRRSAWFDWRSVMCP